MPHYTITKEEAGQKCVAFIQRKYALPKALLYKLIRKGTIRVNAKRCKAFTRLEEGDSIFLPSFMQETPQQAYSSSEQCCDKEKSALHTGCSTKQCDKNAIVHYEDDALLVLNKPAGIPVHNGTRHSYSIASMLEQWYPHAMFPPTLVHRLDKETTGILLIAKTYSMLRFLHDAWRAHNVKKYYLAWVRGRWQESGVHYIENAIERTKQGITVSEGNDVAITVRCLQHSRASSLLFIELHTGKTHQIRAQLAYRGFPLIGDSKYGMNSKNLPLFLHATGIYITKDIHYMVLPHHWYGNFALSVALPYDAYALSQVLSK